MTREALGRIAYEAYCEERKWVSVQGLALPDWHEQRPRLREAWSAAAMAVAKHVSKTLGLGDTPPT